LTLGDSPVTDFSRASSCASESPMVCRLFELGHIGVNHESDKLLEADLRLPANKPACFRWICQQKVYLRRAEELWIYGHMTAPVESDMIEGDLHKLLHTVSLSCSNDVIVRFFLLQHQPHGSNIIAGKAPISFCPKVAEAHFCSQSQLDLSDPMGNLTG